MKLDIIGQPEEDVFGAMEEFGHQGENDTNQTTGTYVKTNAIRLRKMTLIPFVIGFFLLSTFVAGIINLNNISGRFVGEYFISLDLRSTTTSEKRAEIEKELLGMYGVRGTKYVSKRMAFKHFQKQLGVALPAEENSLPDSITVFCRSKADVEAVQKKFEDIEEIKETYVDTRFINYCEEMSKFCRILVSAIFFILFLPTVIWIFFVFYNGCSIEYMATHEYSTDEPLLRKRCKSSGFFQLFAGAAIGVALFLNVYIATRNQILTFLGDNSMILSFHQVYLKLIVVVAIICLLLVVLPYFPSEDKNISSDGDLS